MNLPFISILLMGCMDCYASSLNLTPKRTNCLLQDGRADCSHLSLKEIPFNLPRNITSLDLSHNKFTALNSTTLALYPALRHLDVSYNSIAKLDAGLCERLPSLEILRIAHNVVHLLQEKDLKACSNLTQLDLAHNKLKFKGEPFAALQVKFS